MLNDVDFATSGIYRCEVSAEAPSFQTVSDHGEIIVVGEYSKQTNGEKQKSPFQI